MEPVLLVVSPDPAAGAGLGHELGRYRRDYRVEMVADGGDVVARLAEIDSDGGSVAMVMADVSADPLHAVDVLARVRGANPTVRRVLVVDWGLSGDQMPFVSRAHELGVVDIVLTRPTGPRDEEFHAAITEDLREWAWTTAPVVEAVKIVGSGTGREHEIHELLNRLGVPSGVHHPDSDVGSAIARQAPGEQRRTLVEVMGTTILADPTDREIAAAFGATVDVGAAIFDLAVVGAGPAGLGAAVYGASEGLSTLVIEGQAFGGQAGTSSMIRNYLGFPGGVSGRQLGRRAVLQAAAFGAALDLARSVTGPSRGRHTGSSSMTAPSPLPTPSCSPAG